MRTQREQGPDPRVLARLDQSFMRMRRIVARSPVSALPIPSIGRHVDVAKVLACSAISLANQPDSQGAAPTVKDVAGILELEHSTASRLLSQSEAEGLIVRGTDPSDRRRTTLSLTPAGDSVVADSAAIRTWVMGEVLAEWDSCDLETFVELLERITITFASRLSDVVERAHEHFPLDPE